MAIASDGYVFVPQCVDDHVLQALRKEADSLFSLKRSEDALTEDEYLDKGCALDFFTNNELEETDEARISMAKYMLRRNGKRRHPTGKGSSSTAASGSTPSSATARGLSRDSTGMTASSLSSKWSTAPPQKQDEPCWTNRHISAVRDAIFKTLAGLAWDALKAERCASSAAADEAAPDSATAGGGKLLLFNEQYVVKPPRSSIEFGWHTDEREQLAMCVFAPGARPPVYVSVWVALDDSDSVNGCLEVYPQAWNKAHPQAPREEDDARVVLLPAKAGDAVVFLSNLWHRSGPNQTQKPRRVFYAQYCLEVIRAAPSDPRPLSLAVPCLHSCCSRSGSGALDGERLSHPEKQTSGSSNEGDDWVGHSNVVPVAAGRSFGPPDENHSRSCEDDGPNRKGKGGGAGTRPRASQAVGGDGMGGALTAAEGGVVPRSCDALGAAGSREVLVRKRRLEQVEPDSGGRGRPKNV